MTRIISQPPAMSPGCGCMQNRPIPYQMSTLVQNQSVSAYERLDAGLTIRTREGDLVTLSSSSFNQLESKMYNSQGTIVTEDGRVTARVTQREITLSSGRQFAFTVQGDLNARELEDIDSIIKGIDSILSEMVSGNMDDALAKALSMGGYDSVSEFSADLTYHRSYRMMSQTRSETSGPAMIPDMAAAAVPDRQVPGIKADPLALIRKILEQLEDREEKLFEASQKPMDKLFGHHMNDLKKITGIDNKVYQTIKQSREMLGQVIDNRLAQTFKGAFDLLSE